MFEAEYIRRCENQIAGWETLRTSLEDPAHERTVERSMEFGASIIHSMQTGQPAVTYGNVADHGIIDNLPAGCTVEVPCMVDRNGVQPTRIGTLPPQLAALIQTNSTCSHLWLRRSSAAIESTCTTRPCSIPILLPSSTSIRSGQWLMS